MEEVPQPFLFQALERVKLNLDQIGKTKVHWNTRVIFLGQRGCHSSLLTFD